MGLEAGDYIDDLNPAWPLSTDLRRQGDDHLRLIKRCLQQSFPNINAPVTATPAQLNQLEAIITALTEVLEPVGTIKGWDYVNEPTVPTGWQLCDGTNVPGYGTVPDLRSRFVLGVSVVGDAGNTGGSGSVNSSADGDHTHGGNTGSHTLTTAQIPSHTHGLAMQTFVDEADVGSGVTYIRQGSGLSTAAEGGGEGHSHTIAASGTHTHSVSMNPPYYSFVWIVKVAATELS